MTEEETKESSQNIDVAAMLEENPMLKNWVEESNISEEEFRKLYEQNQLALDEGLRVFLERYEYTEELVEALAEAVMQNDNDTATKHWRVLKVELAGLQGAAVQMNMAGLGEVVRERLNTVLARVNEIYQEILDMENDQPDATAHTKATQAYQSDS